MNKQRLEMMRVMMERVVAGSWVPQIDATELSKETIRRIAPDVVVSAFNLDSWATPISTKPYTQATGGSVVCGFSACAVGHACFDEEFRKLGWSWSGSQPMFDGEEGIKAAARFFDISEYQSERLFLPESYGYDTRVKYNDLSKKVREAKMVADRIERMLEGV